MRPTLTLTRAQIETSATTRGSGWLDAVLTIARPDADRFVIHTCDWHELTRQFTTGKTVTPGKRPCCEGP